MAGGRTSIHLGVYGLSGKIRISSCSLTGDMPATWLLSLISSKHDLYFPLPQLSLLFTWDIPGFQELCKWSRQRNALLAGWGNTPNQETLPGFHRETGRTPQKEEWTHTKYRNIVPSLLLKNYSLQITPTNPRQDFKIKRGRMKV